MRAMLLQKAGEPLRLTDIPVPEPGLGQVLLQVHACAVCRTDLHVVDGELTNPKLPLIPGHEIVATVAELGGGVIRFKIGDRVVRPAKVTVVDPEPGSEAAAAEEPTEQAAEPETSADESGASSDQG